MTSLCFLANQVSGVFGGILRPHICMYRFPPKTGIWAFVCGQKSNSGCAGFQNGGERMLGQSLNFFLIMHAMEQPYLISLETYNLKGSLIYFLGNFRISVVDKNQLQSQINLHSAILGIHNWTCSSQLSSLQYSQFMLLPCVERVRAWSQYQSSPNWCTLSLLFLGF